MSHWGVKDSIHDAQEVAIPSSGFRREIRGSCSLISVYMGVQGIKIKGSSWSFFSEAVDNFSRGTCLEKQWQQHGMPTLSLWTVLGSASPSPVQWLLASSGGPPSCPASCCTSAPWRDLCWGTATPLGKLCLEKLCYWINKAWTTFGAGIKGTYFCCNHTESFFWKCKVSM